MSKQQTLFNSVFPSFRKQFLAAGKKTKQTTAKQHDRESQTMASVVQSHDIKTKFTAPKK